MNNDSYMADWIRVARNDFGEQWEWSIFEAYYSPSARRYFWDHQGGCSCNWWETPESVEEWQSGDRAALISVMRSIGFFAEDIQSVAMFKEPTGATEQMTP